MNLGQLIVELSKLPPDMKLCIGAPVRLVPMHFESYRGYYEDLAITYDDGRHSPRVGKFLATAKACIDREFVGYKGGEYRMHEGTRVWISNYGSCSGFLATDVSVSGIIYEVAYINGRMVCG